MASTFCQATDDIFTSILKRNQTELLHFMLVIHKFAVYCSTFHTFLLVLLLLVSVRVGFSLTMNVNVFFRLNFAFPQPNHVDSFSFSACFVFIFFSVPIECVTDG